MSEKRRTSAEKLFEAESGKRTNDTIQVISGCPLPADQVMTDTEALLDICHEKDPATLKRGTLGTFNGVFIFQFMCTW